MRLLGKLISDLTAQDILALVTGGVPEGQQLDYKRELPGRSDGDRKDFIKDVCALANRDGGVLVYGIEERVENGAKTGRPETIPGIGAEQIAGAASRLSQMIRANTDPALTGCVVRDLDLGDAVSVLLIGVPKSILAPHAVTVTKGGTYWRRAGDQNYAVESRELRRLFLQGEEWRTQAEEFRRDRVVRVRAGEVVPNLDVHGSFFLHVLPLGRLHESIDVVRHRDEMHAENPDGLSWRCRPNLDGVFVWQPGSGNCKSYVQWFRCGGAEFYTSQCHIVRKDAQVLDLAQHLVVRAIRASRALVRTMTARLDMQYPLILFLSLYDLAGGGILVDEHTRFAHEFDEQANEFQANEILLPGILLEGPDVDVKEAVASGLDWIWQSAGFNDCYVRRFREFPGL